MWTVMPCSSEKSRRFERSYRFHLQGRTLSKKRGNAGGRLISASRLLLLLGLLLVLEDGREKF
jgi:hypothetical protein